VTGQEIDVRALDTARPLAADAVQKACSGHPGTAMSLAPLAYLLFQNVLVHDSVDEQWLGRDGLVLSAGRPSGPVPAGSHPGESDDGAPCFIGLVPGKATLPCVPGRPGGTPEPRLTDLVRVVR
jgi:hypothetical protein